MIHLDSSMHKYVFECIYMKYLKNVDRPKTCLAERAPANILDSYKRMFLSTRLTEHVSERVEFRSRHFDLKRLVLRLNTVWA